MSVSLPSRDQYIPPATLREAEDLYAELNETCTLIQASLSNKDHRDEDGNRLSDHEYHQWRGRATWALAKKRVHMGRVKRWITACKAEAARIEAGVEKPNDVVELFGALLRIVKTVAGSDLTAREQAIVLLAERWIRVKGAPAVVAAREKAAS